MIVKAKGRYLRISAMKLRKVMKVIKNMSVNQSLASLKLLPNKSAKMLYKVIFSAVSNYKSLNPNENVKDWQFELLSVDEGPSLRRMMPRARGRADIIHKQTAHVNVFIKPIDNK